MFLKPGFKDEYQRRHAAIFPELKQLLTKQVSGTTLFIWMRTQMFYMHTKR